MEEVYSESWLLGKEGRFGEYKENGSKIWEKNEYRSETIREVRYSGRKRL